MKKLHRGCVASLLWDCITSSPRPPLSTAHHPCGKRPQCAAAEPPSSRADTLTHYYEHGVSKSEFGVPSHRLLLTHWLMSSLFLGVGKGSWASRAQDRSSQVCVTCGSVTDERELLLSDCRPVIHVHSIFQCLILHSTWLHALRLTGHDVPMSGKRDSRVTWDGRLESKHPAASQHVH